MEHFSIGSKGKTIGQSGRDIKQSDKVRESDEAFTMNVSPICTTADGKKYAFVTFRASGNAEGEREAEGRIPECKIIKSQGFTDDEKEILELYMKSNLAQLKKMAAGTNVMRAMMKGDTE